MTPKEIKAEFDYIKSLTYNWDGEEAIEPKPETIAIVEEFVGNLNDEQRHYITDICPYYHGTINIEIEECDFNFVSIEFGDKNYAMFGQSGGKEFTIDFVEYPLFDVAMTHINIMMGNLRK